MSHTPGPWRITDDLAPETASENYHYISGGNGYCLDNDQSGFTICGYLSSGDACLMAAAPELLQALKWIVDITDRKHDAWDAAHAAITKAEGK